MKKLLLVLFMLPTIVFGRKFYFSSGTGNDGYTVTQAQNQATPWASLRKITQLTTGTNGPTILQPGDTLCFKRGDVFANGSSTDTYCSAYWVNTPGDSYFTAPSGTPSNPIVITNYGDPTLPLPNWLHPRAYYPVSTWVSREGRAIIQFSGVHDIIIDGIQSNDYRVPANDKANPGYSGGWIIGEWTRGTSVGLRNSYVDPTRRTKMVTNFIVRNCKFNNTMYGIQSYAAIDSKVTNCIFTNLKSSADTAGTNDVGAGALEGVNGIRCEFSYNYIKGAWGKSGRLSSTNGLLGVGFDMFNLYNSKVVYNTIIDCNGAIEIGNLDNYDTVAGFQYDTIAFNKVINCGQLLYSHGSAGDVFAGNNHHIAIWNNVIISNNKDRHEGLGFGQDMYGDGQGWAPGTSQPWWFCRNPFSTWNVGPMTPSVNTTSGSNVITVSSAAGISVGSVAFADNNTILGNLYKTVTVTAISGTSITLSDPCTATLTGTYAIKFYLPVSNGTWSVPFNASFSNYGGKRFFIQYGGDATKYGSSIDTMYDCRNNILYWTTGLQGVYDRNRFKRSANLYYTRGGALYPTAVGGTLNFKGTKEIAYSSGNLFQDTLSSVYPENWDLTLNAVDAPATYAKTNGVPIQGFTVDFAGNSIVGATPFIGLYKPVTVVVPTLVASSSGTTILCDNDASLVTVSATGGTPPYIGTGNFTAGAGTYTYTVTDSKGSSATTTITLTEPTAISGSVSFTPISVMNGTTTVTLSSTGGVGDKTYSLDGGSYQSGTTFSSVAAGSHSIVIKDSNGCTHPVDFTVTYNSSILKTRLKFKN